MSMLLLTLATSSMLRPKLFLFHFLSFFYFLVFLMIVFVAVDRVLFLLRLLHVDDVSGSLKDLLSPGLEVLDSQRPHLAGKSLHLFANNYKTR